jgi:LemA protein
MNKNKWIVLGVVVLVVLFVWSSYNSLITLNQGADAQWAQVESVYQRRLDLIPNLEASVKGDFAQEKTIFGDIDKARTQYAGAQTPDAKAAAASNVESSLGRLLAVVENYPTLASSGLVSGLMTELEGTENRISVERMKYNDMIRIYNTKVMTFPTNLLAGLFGQHARAYFQAATGADVAPKVNLQ